MVKCPNCQAKYPDNTLFCDECGAYLLAEDGKKETDPLLIVSGVILEETSEVPEEEVTSPLGLKLKIPAIGREVEVSLTKEVNIGRLDPASASFPEIDLTNYGGLEKGVSRRHIKIIRRGNKVFIEDLGSLNGTFLNHKKLTPYLPQPLKSGDELQLGELVLQVGFSQ